VSKLDYKFIIKNAEHYKAINQKHFYMDREISDFPWHLVTKIEEGAFYGEFASSLRFTAYDMEHDFQFSWHVDIKEIDKSYYAFEIDKIETLFTKLQPEMKLKLDLILNTIIAKLDEHRRALYENEELIKDALARLNAIIGAQVGNTTVKMKKI